MTVLSTRRARITAAVTAAALATGGLVAAVPLAGAQAASGTANVHCAAVAESGPADLSHWPVSITVTPSSAVGGTYVTAKVSVSGSASNGPEDSGAHSFRFE